MHACDVYVVFVEAGQLLLVVGKDVYEQLGLQGTQSRYQKHRYGESHDHRVCVCTTKTEPLS